MNIHAIPCGPIATNSYVAYHSRQALLIDPAEFRPIQSYLEQKQLAPFAILLTHGHFDHILALTDFRTHYPDLPIYIHPEDECLLFDSQANGSSAFVVPYSLSASDRVCLYDKSMQTPLGEVEIICVPGHTPGSVALKLDKHIFTGDFIFKESIGRTDFSRGSPRDMQDSLKQFVQRFQDEAQSILLYPGHGEGTILAHELQFNPFLDRITKHMGQ